jgi:CheY-like chemotaxis protein
VGKCILIVDDDDDIREIASTSLELTFGWRVLAARSGREALDIATRSNPDAILMDVMMPDMDGPTAFALLRSNLETSETPVILLTAKVQPADRQRYLRMGVQGVIAKPFDPMRLAETVAGMLDWGAF